MADRLFVALWPPAPVVGCLQEALADLRPRYPDLKWQAPERWHITLAFLGERGVAKELQRFGHIRTVPAEPVALAGSGRFGAVLWVGMRAGEWLGRLVREVQTTMGVDERRFAAHITVARSRSNAGDRQLRLAMDDLASFTSPAWTPSDYTLVRSTLGPRPTYEVIARRALAVNGAP